MNSATPALLALLLVFSLVAIPVAAGPEDEARDSEQPTLREHTLEQATLQERTMTNDAAANETTNRLSLEGSTRTEYAEYGADLGTLLASTDDTLRVDYDQYRILDREFETASADERETMVREAYERIEERTGELEERERTAVSAHAEGELSTAELLQEVLRNHHEAGVLSAALGHIEDRADRISGYDIDVQDDQNELEMHRTPVRTHLEQAARSETSESIVAVETTETGYAISYIDGGDYVREATRFDNRDTDRETQFDDITDAYDHAGELYPWVFENGRSPTANEHTTVQLYQIQATHDQGRLEAYLDGGTGEVHREVQVLSRANLPTASETVWTADGQRLSLNETPKNGPVEVTLTDSETGEPVSGRVTVDGFELGATDEDGSIWFVPPAKPYELTVTTDATTIEATVTNR
ncbi:DUF7096 domain-containing protein [Haloterrigena alkaliphila]|uniref:Uncharacterized protein n=1 Tax=Haloterrigena alkaliphila TaxID=2816475 RepID=A0A8A2VFR0_9EURY|nr:hypothetical protein [Haloterrigena alkaliphila]QSX00147.1 hypothetical protein J0X25_04040 [Haloterrigena alkaliphila]